MSTQEQIDQLNPATSLSTVPEIVDIDGFSTTQKSNDGIVWPMKDPNTGLEVGFSLIIMGQDSIKHKKRLRHLRDQNQFELRKNSKYIKSQDVVENDQVETVASMIKGWSPFRYQGRVWVYSPETAEEFIKQFDEFRDQVEEVIYDRKNFLANNAKTFSPSQSTTSISA